MMLPQNYNVAFKKQLGKVYNFKFGIGVTTKMQIKATVSGGLGSGGAKNLESTVSTLRPLECLSPCWSVLPSFSCLGVSLGSASRRQSA